jgi:curli biogenesis system outer membrane secretion channel CsgG
MLTKIVLVIVCVLLSAIIYCGTVKSFSKPVNREAEYQTALRKAENAIMAYYENPTPENEKKAVETDALLAKAADAADSK